MLCKISDTTKQLTVSFKENFPKLGGGVLVNNNHPSNLSMQNIF